MSCVRCETSPFGSSIPKFDAFLEGQYLKRIFDITGNLSVVAETAAREAITYQAEWGANKPAQPVIFFRYEKGPEGWTWAGEHFLNYFDSSQPGGDRKDRYEKAEKGMPHKGQAIVFSEDLGEGWGKAYIHIYTDHGDYVEGRAYEYRGSSESFSRTKKILEQREKKVSSNINFSEPVYLKEKIEPTELLQAIVEGYDEVDTRSNQDYIRRITNAVNQLPLLQSQFESQVADFAKQAQEQFANSEIGTKLFSDVTHTMVQTLKKESTFLQTQAVEPIRKNQPTHITLREWPAIREPRTDTVGAVASIVEKAMKDTADTLSAAGAFALERIRQKKSEGKNNKTEQKVRTNSQIEFSTDAYQFAQRIVFQGVEKKGVEKRQKSFPKKMIQGLEKIVSFAQSLPRKKEKKYLDILQFRRSKKSEVRSKKRLRMLVEKVTKKNNEKRTFRLVRGRRRAERNFFLKESKIKINKKEIISLKKKRLREAFIKLVKRLRKVEVNWALRNKDIFIVSQGAEKKKKKIFEKQLVVRFAFSWLLWMVTSKYFHLSIDRSAKKKRERLIKKDPARWVLLAIIWYLVMIRESRGAGSRFAGQIHPKKQAAYPPPGYQMPPRGVIFTSAS